MKCPKDHLMVLINSETDVYYCNVCAVSELMINED